MSGSKIELVGWVLGLGLFGLGAVVPGGLIKALSGGRVSASRRELLVLRVLAAGCCVGTIYRLIWLLGQR